MRLHQTKSFCTGKDTTNKMKKQLTECMKIFANDTSYKGLIYKYTKNTTPTKNGQRTWNRLILQRWQMANRYMERCSTWLVTRVTQITATMRNHHTCQNGYYQKDKKKKVFTRTWGKRSLPALLLGMARLQPLLKTVWRFLKNLKMELPYDLAILLLSIFPKKMKTLIRKQYMLYVYCSIIYNSQIRKQR